MKKLTIERTYQAPIEQVWKAFTTAEILKNWWSPRTMTSSFLSVDLKPGGLFRFCFKDTNGNEFWGRGVYQTIRKPSYLSYLDTFSDPEGNPVPPSYFGMEGNAIVESLVEIELSEAGASTVMKITMDNFYDEAMTKEMTRGWNEMFDKLEHSLRPEYSKTI